MPRAEALAQDILREIEQTKELLASSSLLDAEAWWSFDNEPRLITTQDGSDAPTTGFWEWRDVTEKHRLWSFRSNVASPLDLPLQGRVGLAQHYRNQAGVLYANGAGLAIDGRAWLEDRFMIGDFDWTLAFWGVSNITGAGSELRFAEFNEGEAPGRYTGTPNPGAPFAAGFSGTTRVLVGWLGGSATVFRMTCFPGISPTVSARTTLVLTPAANEWYCFFLDYSAGRLRFRVRRGAEQNDFSVYESSLSIPSLNVKNCTQLHMGRTLTGRIDEVAFWRRSLTDSEQDEYYNGGWGITYPKRKMVFLRG